MAGETRAPTVGRLTDESGRLPVRHEPGRGSEPIDPGDQGREVTRGRTPEEVIQAREENRQPARTSDDDGARAPVKFKYRGREMTAEDLTKRPELLNALIQTAEQFPALQKKHVELLEAVAASKNAPPAKPEPPAATEQPQPRITPEALAAHYKSDIEFLVKEGFIEADFPVAYPGVAAAMAHLRATIDDAIVKLNHAIDWIDAEREMRNARKAESILDDAIDKVAAKKGEPYQGLRDENMRAEFKKWIKKDVDPKVGSINEEMIDKLWFAFNADVILEYAKKPDPAPPRPRASADGRIARNGTPEPPEQEKGLLERLSETRLGPAQ